MRCVARKVAAMALLALLALAALAAASPPLFTLTLAAPEQPLKAGGTLLLSLTVTNTSDHEVGFPTGHGSAEAGVFLYQIHVLDDLGPPVPRMLLPCQRSPNLCVASESTQTTPLKPSESLTDEVNVTSLYDLSRPGKYKIWVAEPFYRGPDQPNGLVTSNVVMVTVVK